MAASSHDQSCAVRAAFAAKAEHQADARRKAERAAADDARRGFSDASATAWMNKHAPTR